jgi:peptidoglycan L-alanyl-D-glutamate endopeptidase CwlK
MELRQVCLEAFKTVPFDVIVLEGFRTKERQDKLYKEGATKVRTSRHESGYAIDIAPYPIDWDDWSRFKTLADHMYAAAKKLGVTIRWGGNWSRIDSNQPYPPLKPGAKKLIDGPHFEIPA